MRWLIHAPDSTAHEKARHEVQRSRTGRLSGGRSNLFRVVIGVEFTERAGHLQGLLDSLAKFVFHKVSATRLARTSPEEPTKFAADRSFHAYFVDSHFFRQYLYFAHASAA